MHATAVRFGSARRDGRRSALGLFVIGLGLVLCGRGQPAPTGADEAALFTAPGFEREGSPQWASGAGTALVRIVVRDESTGQPIACRLNVVGPDGNYYQPERNRLSRFALTGAWPKPGSWGNRLGKGPYRYLGRFFYSTGETQVRVPAGRIRVEVWKGLEYRPAARTVEVEPGETHDTQITLAHVAPMVAAGYFAGDSHLHLRRANDGDEDDIFDLLEAEGIQFGGLLAYNDPEGPYHGMMPRQEYPQFKGLGRASIRQRGNTAIISGQEYRTATYGHLCVYMLDDLVFPGGRFNADAWPTLGAVGRDVLSRGGVTIHAHGGNPSPSQPPDAQAIWADVALGAISAVELLQFAVYFGVGLERWYDILNCGYRLPAVAASDYPPCRTLGDSRTYVHHASGAPGVPEWFAGLAAGRSFITTGPLLLLEVDGQPPGARIDKSGAGPHTVKVRVRVRCEVTEVTRLELIVNGTVFERRVISSGEARGRWFGWEAAVPIATSTWVAARAHGASRTQQPDAEAHANPVYIYMDGRAPFRIESLDAWVGRIDEAIARQSRRTILERDRVLAYFRQARDILLKIRAQGGLPADADPTRMADEMGGAVTSVSAAAAEGARTEDRELKEFLKPIPPKPPDVAVRTIETSEGFEVQLVAAEPMVRSPVAAAFDENGNLYVAEMRDYPYNGNEPVRVAVQRPRIAANDGPSGTIRLLRDLDGDGRFDESHVFADRLLWAAGIAPWRGGVFVTAPPDIWYLKDTDGDFKADIRRKVFTGFGTQNQQAMVNTLQFALDHRIYGSTSSNGGVVHRVDDFDPEPISLRGRDFRFDPILERLEAVTGTKQFGLSFDDWGNRFLCSESEPCFHVVLPREHLDRNPHVTIPATIASTTPRPTRIHRISPIENWRKIRSNRWAAGGDRPADGANVSHHVIDAASGVTIYRGGAYPPQYYGNVFVADGQNNLVHRRILEPDGVTFKTRRAEESTEFVRSADTWFRPVNLVNAHDGTLYLLDMSREFLETVNLPADVEQHLDLLSGRDQGRIYRIVPRGYRPPPPPRLGASSSLDLVRTLESPHGWWRDTAHRLLYERGDRSVIPALERLARDGATPQARVHALWSLRGLQALNEPAIAAGLADEHPGVRANAVRLAEPHLASSAELRAKLGAMVDDPDASVRLRVALAAGEWKSGGEAGLLFRLFRRDGTDAWMQSAILSSAANCVGELFSRIVADADLMAGAATVEFVQRILRAIGAQNDRGTISRALDWLDGSRNPAEALQLFSALHAGLNRAGHHAGAIVRDPRVARMLERAAGVATDVDEPVAMRRAAVEVLGLDSYARAAPILLPLLAEQHPRSLQLVAATTLAQFREPEAGRDLLERAASLSRPVRQRVIDVLIERPERVDTLWAAIRGGTLAPAELAASQIEFLRKHPVERIRREAVIRFGATNAASRADVYSRFRPSLQLAGVPERGRKHFEERCAACHRFADSGHEFGPDLTGIGTRGRAQLLSSIIDPNREVMPQYFIHTVETSGGETFGGILKSETPTSLTLRQPGGGEKTVARAHATAVRVDPVSIMPEGLESGMTVQDMADLFEFLAAAAGP